MFSELTLRRDVTIGSENSKQESRFCQSFRRMIMTRLLKDLETERVCKVHGYYLGVTALLKIGKGKAVCDDPSGAVSFPVFFKCRTFRPFRGEVLNGVVYRVCNSGVFLRCGPMKSAYISYLKMPGYRIENHRFVSEDRAAIESGVVLTFNVLAVRWSSGTRNGSEFQMLGNLDGEFLGPVYFPASGELDL